jgi:serine/threonine protein kinase
MLVCVCLCVVCIASALRSPHVVFFFGACFEPSMYIVLEFCHKGTLSDVLMDTNEDWTWPRALRAMIDATKGLLCLHGWKPPIVHRDLKTLNLLVRTNVMC